MDIIFAAEKIKDLYRSGGDESEWKFAIEQFNRSLRETTDPYILEVCALSDPNWELSVDQRQSLLRSAKHAGASSRQFLLDYYGFMEGTLDPGPEQLEAQRQLRALMEANGSL